MAAHKRFQLACLLLGSCSHQLSPSVAAVIHVAHFSLLLLQHERPALTSGWHAVSSGFGLSCAGACSPPGLHMWLTAGQQCELAQAFSMCIKSKLSKALPI